MSERVNQPEVLTAEILQRMDRREESQSKLTSYFLLFL